METQIKNLSQTQFDLLSWFATCLNHPLVKSNDSLYMAKLSGIESSLAFAGIDDNLVFQVKFLDRKTGLRNWNRLASIELFN